MPAKPFTLSEMAARWYLHMREPHEPSEYQAFQQWLSEDVRHAAEYDSIVRAMHQLNSTESLASLADAAEQHTFLTQETRRKARQRRVGQVFAIFLFSVMGMLFYHQYQDWQAAPVMQMAAQNPVGQIALKTLDDGTRVALSARSKMEVTYYRHQRHVLLKEGEAVFEVVKNPQKPFVVETDTAIITVLGTRFAVNRLDGLVRISVDHGRVKVEPKQVHPSAQDVPVESRIITNNQVLEVYPNHATVLVNRPASDAFAFLDGRLVFDRASVSEIATTVSRYRLKPVEAQGRPLRNISADINIQDIEQFLRGLPNIASVDIRETAEHTLIVSQP